MNIIGNIYEAKLRDKEGHVLMKSRVSTSDKINFKNAIKTLCEKEGLSIHFSDDTDSSWYNKTRKIIRESIEEERKKTKEYFKKQ